MEEGTFGPLLHAKFHPHRCNASPLRGEKPQNRPLSKRNTGRFALRAMLPVKIAISAPSFNFVRLYLLTYRQSEKHFKHQYLPTCLYNMVNFGLLAAEIVSLVWGTPANFNGFCVLAALLHGTLVVGVSRVASVG